ncbi:hypothetical protein GCM10009639_01180 [Kitasatospora putterlickiae]|uniref:Uncharacterized protein n=1 Tax=Kitasatospora putterlickiae TaxID=221725 RepID=A0ABN1XIS1_9ACTN
MKYRLLTIGVGTVAALLLVAAFRPTDHAPEPGTPLSAYAPSVMPSAPDAEDSTAAFTRWVEQHGTEEQREAVLGHVTRVNRAVKQDDHVNAYLATDHPEAVDARTRAIIRAYLKWAGPNEPARMLVLYDGAGRVMGAIRVADWS